jgi:small-conductance mechanosensitive channel
MLNRIAGSILARKEIREPSDLRGKKIGIANFGGATELSVILALKKWHMPPETVTLIQSGSPPARLTALMKGALDASPLAPPQSIEAARRGLNVLIDFKDIEAFPSRVIAVRRSFLEKNRETVKRFLKAYSEAVYQFNNDKKLGIATYAKWLKEENPKVNEEVARMSGFAKIHPQQPESTSFTSTASPPASSDFIAAVVLLVMLLLTSLWALGLEITPLLAGAGLVGIALGFGAQALVRDVIAGIFYLAEDAFRIGEYIEAGGNTKGTVERITLRTVALRHHNGPLHFVPYGALGTVRNTSRDWVIEKFNLPLPIDADSEKVRKLIKKVGEELMADAEVGHLLLEPLKGKLYRIDPGVKIFRCKFRTAPGNQFDVRAQAYKRIEAALKQLGIGFADGKQTVLLGTPPT